MNLPEVTFRASRVSHVQKRERVSLDASNRNFLFLINKSINGHAKIQKLIVDTENNKNK